jgi:hypothetical protein
MLRDISEVMYENNNYIKKEVLKESDVKKKKRKENEVKKLKKSIKKIMEIIMKKEKY